MCVQSLKCALIALWNVYHFCFGHATASSFIESLTHSLIRSKCFQTTVLKRVDQLLITMLMNRFVWASYLFIYIFFVKCCRSLRYYALIMRIRKKMGLTHLFHFVRITSACLACLCVWESVTIIPNFKCHLIGIVRCESRKEEEARMSFHLRGKKECMSTS